VSSEVVAGFRMDIISHDMTYQIPTQTYPHKHTHTNILTQTYSHKHTHTIISYKALLSLHIQRLQKIAHLHDIIYHPTITLYDHYYYVYKDYKK
jgi:hypothetical protein